MNFFKRKIKYIILPFLLVCSLYIAYQLVIFVQLSSIGRSASEAPSSFVNRGNLLLGIHQARSSYYEARDDGKFHCIESEEWVSADMVNDDYCDCLDGSDEPGTNACSNGKFYCTNERRVIESNRVNDGVCDCCDGSDEYKHIKSPITLSLDIQTRLGRFLSPCSHKFCI